MESQNRNKRLDMNDETIVIERLFATPVSRVWSAITEKKEMKEWYFDLDHFKAQKGFVFEFSGGPSPEKQYVHHCEITEVIPQKKLSYSWRYVGYPGNSVVTFDLTESDGGTLLRLTHSGIKTFAQDNPDFALHNFEEGWNQIIHGSLKNYLEA
ncbi:MAG: SRPBCC family protein [Bacteroidia bacterium]